MTKTVTWSRPAAARPRKCESAPPWPGIFPTIWGQPEKHVATCYQKCCHDKASTDGRDWPCFSGDGELQAADGYYRSLGRVDDVTNVAGHPPGTNQPGAAAITVPEVPGAAAVPVLDEMRGWALEMGTALKPGFQPSPEIGAKVTMAMEVETGEKTRPTNVRIVWDVPKTRPGKIRRQVMAGIPTLTKTGGTTTLANPEIVEDGRHHVRCRPSAA